MYPEILPAQAFAFLLVFTRISAVMMVVPALGEQSIPTRIRLVIALAFSFLVYSLIGDTLPVMPPTPLELAALLISEVLVGVMIGLVPRIAMGALHVAGSSMAIQTGLAAAQQFDPTQRSQGALIAGFLSFMGLVLIFVMDLHHLLIIAARNSYNLFPVGGGISVTDFATLATNIVSSSFEVGLQIAAPFLVYGLIFYFSLGLIARLNPSLQIFFIAMPMNIMIGFVLLLFVISAMMFRFADYFQDQLQPLVQ